jgi:hypothetical protein
MNAIMKAVVKTVREVPQLGKADRNQFAKYSYVSIDKYYEIVAKIAASNGLVWQPREVECEILPNTGKDGAIKAVYAFDLYHEDGESRENYASFTIIHPIQGAQTAGSAMAYAEKLFMRSCFKVQTGEQDADATNPDDLKTAARQLPEVKKVLESFPDATVTDVRPKGTAVPADPSPKVAVIARTEADGTIILKTDTTDWKSAAEVLQMGLAACKNVNEIKSLWTKNIAVIEKMGEADADTHAAVRSAFNSRRAELKKA